MKMEKTYNKGQTLFLSLLVFFTTLSSGHNEQMLLDRLFSNYSPSVRPVLRPKNIINLTFNLKIWQLISVDERNEKITIQCYYQMRWRNELLVWQPEDWGGIHELIVQSDRVWLPDVILYNVAGTNTHFVQKGTDSVKIYSNGDQMWHPQVLLEASFVANTRYFPYDVQEFPLMYESWTLNIEKLRIHKDERKIVDKHYANNSEWNLVATSKTVTIHKYDTNDTYDSITFMLTYRRKPTYYVVSLILPCALLATVIYFSYFLPASSGERSGVVVTILLAFAVFLDVLRGSLPHNSTSILSTYVIVIMFQCSLSFLGTCVVITLRQKGNNEKKLKPPPHWIRKLLRMDEMNTIDKCKSCRPGLLQKKIAHDLSYDMSFMASNLHNASDDSVVYLRQKTSQIQSLQLKELKDMTRHLKLMSSTISETNSDNEVQMQWNYLAKIIDRTCRNVFFIVVVISHIIMVILYKAGNPYFDFEY